MNDKNPHDEEREKPHPLALGHRLDEFELLEVIGEGGFGIVYRAYDHSLQREVAIKEYMPSMLARRVGDNSVHVRSERLTATFEAGLRSFINEARTLAQFSHPALVRVHRFWESNSTAYMAIQLYKGRTLRRMADEEPVRITEAWLLGVLGPLLGALETLHRSQCFHRDIAPDNIFLQHDDLPVLLDFGAARKSIADLVDEVAVMVKSGYSPIEQYADDNTLLQGPWTDLYALGAVLYRAVTGNPPPSAVVRSVQDAYVPLSSMGRADLSPAFCAAVDHTLAVHSKDRTQTVAAFAAELGLVKLGDIYVSGMGVPATLIATAPVSATPPPPPLAPQDFAPMSAPAPLDAMASGAFVAPPAAVAEPVRAARAEAKTQPVAASKPQQKKSRTPWAAVTGLVVALVAVGGWIGYRLTAGGGGQQDTTTAMAPAPGQGTPMSNPSSPPAVMPAAGAASAAAAATPNANAPLTPLDSVPVAPPTASAGATPAAAPTSPTPTPMATTTASATPPAATPPTATGTTPATTVPVVPGALPPDAALATTELEDWNLAQAENTREGYDAYLRRYRRGLHARDARNAIAELAKTAPPTEAGTPVVASTTAGTTSAAAPPGMGRIVFNVRPWGQVFVDGADRGVSPPLKTLALRPGIYNIEVRNGDLDVFRQRVTVQDSKSAPVVSHEFK